MATPNVKGEQNEMDRNVDEHKKWQRRYQRWAIRMNETEEERHEREAMEAVARAEEQTEED